MTKVTEGKKDTIECTGSARRDSTTNLNNKRPASQADAANAAKNAVQKAQEIFGEKQGLYYQDGKWYINAEVVQVLNLVADAIVAGVLSSNGGLTFFDLGNGLIHSESEQGEVVEIKNGEIYSSGESGFARMWIGGYNVSGGPGIRILGEGLNAPVLGGIMAGDEMQIMARNLDNASRVLETRNVGWKTVNGEKVLVAYD